MPIRLLVVDDHALFRQGLVSLFKRQADIEVVGEAGTVAQAVKSARLNRPEMILMDFSLPDGTGLDATRIILSIQPNIKIVFLSMQEEDERIIEAVRAGAIGYLLKDIPINRLLDALRGVYKGEAALSRHITARLLQEIASQQPSPKAPTPLDTLSQRELEVLRLMAEGLSNQQIADRLFISENTVRNHVHNLLDKLAVENRRQAIGVLHQFGGR